MTIVKTDLYLR